MKESPMLFMKLWCIPAVIHHIIFRVLVQIGPILIFFSGMCFTVVLIAYLILIVFDVPSEEYRTHWHHLHPPKSFQIEDKLRYMKQGYFDVVDDSDVINCPSCNLRIKVVNKAPVKTVCVGVQTVRKTISQDSPSGQSSFTSFDSVRMSEIEKEERDPETGRYKHEKLYQDPKTLEEDQPFEDIQDLNQFFQKTAKRKQPPHKEFLNLPTDSKANRISITLVRDTNYRYRLSSKRKENKSLSPDLGQYFDKEQKTTEIKRTTILSPGAVSSRGKSTSKLKEEMRNSRRHLSQKIKTSGDQEQSKKLLVLKQTQDMNFESVVLNKLNQSSRISSADERVKKIMKLFRSILEERTCLSDYDVLQEFLMNQLDLEDEKLLNKIQQARNLQEEEQIEDQSDEEDIGEKINQKLFGDVQQIKQEGDNIIKKFSSLKEQNNRFQQFIQQYIQTEKDHWESVKDLKLEFEIFEEDIKTIKRKRFSQQDALKVIEKQKKKVDQEKRQRNKKNRNASCSPLTFFRPNNIGNSVEKDNPESPIKLRPKSSTISHLKTIRKNSFIIPQPIGIGLQNQPTLSKNRSAVVTLALQSQVQQQQQDINWLNSGRSRANSVFSPTEVADERQFGQIAEQQTIPKPILSQKTFLPGMNSQLRPQPLILKKPKRQLTTLIIEEEKSMASGFQTSPHTSPNELHTPQHNQPNNDLIDYSPFKSPMIGESPDTGKNHVDSAGFSPELESTSLKLFEQLLRKVEQKHKLIQLSCNDPILTKVNKTQQQLDEQEELMTEKYIEATKSMNQIQKKLKKHKRALKELNQAMFQATDAFLSERKKEKVDQRIIIETQMRYKQAYVDVQDKRSKILELEEQFNKQKENHFQINEQIQQQLAFLTKEMDDVFRGIVKILISNFQIRTEFEKLGPILPQQSPQMNMQIINGQALALPEIERVDRDINIRQLFFQASAENQNEEEMMENEGDELDQLETPGIEQYRTLAKHPTFQYKKIALPQFEFFDSETLHLTFNETKEFLLEIPLRIDLKVQRLQMISGFLVKVSLLFQDYANKLIWLAQVEEKNMGYYKIVMNDIDKGTAMKEKGDSSSDDEEKKVEEKLMDRISLKEKIFSTYQNKLLQFLQARVRLGGTNNSMKKKVDEFIQIYHQQSKVEIQETLTILKQLFQEVVTSGLWQMNIIAEKNNLFQEIIKLEEMLANCQAVYTKHITVQIDKMERSNQDLFDKETRLEYIQNLKEPDKEGSTRNRLALLLKNASLIRMQFSREDQLPSVEMLKQEIDHQLRKTNGDFRNFMKQAEKIQDELIEVEKDAEKKLQNFEMRLCEDVVKGYQFAHTQFADLYESLNKKKRRSDSYEEQHDNIFSSSKSDDIQKVDVTFQHRNTIDGPFSHTQFKIDQRQIKIDDMEQSQNLEVPTTKRAHTLNNSDQPLREDMFEDDQSSHSFTDSNSNVSILEMLKKEMLDVQRQVEKDQMQPEFQRGYLAGKKEIIGSMNQAVKIFWEVWKTSPAFKATVMKDIYTSLNKNRPKMIEEIVVTNYEHRGPPPKCFDIKHLTPLLCQNQEREFMSDVICQMKGEVEVCAETIVNIYTLKIPVFVKGICQNVSAKARFYYNSLNTKSCYLQWIGKPVIRVDVQPRIGKQFNLSSVIPKLKETFENFLNDQLIAFEKEPIEIPMTEIPEFVQRYEFFKPVPHTSVGCQANISMNKYRRQFLKNENLREIRDPSKYRF